MEVIEPMRDEAARTLFLTKDVTWIGGIK